MNTTESDLNPKQMLKLSQQLANHPDWTWRLGMKELGSNRVCMYVTPETGRPSFAGEYGLDNQFDCLPDPSSPTVWGYLFGDMLSLSQQVPTLPEAFMADLSAVKTDHGCRMAAMWILYRTYDAVGVLSNS